MNHSNSNMSGVRQLDYPIVFGYAADMREILTQLYGGSDPAEIHACFKQIGEDREFVIVSYAHDDNADALKCFDTDIVFRMIFEEFDYDNNIIYSHYLKSTWYKVFVDGKPVLENVILEELNDRQWLSGLIVTIGERSFLF
ncbi:hypothetical protein FV228_03585 [Methylobacterium sp. WL18]|uniref:hypothetical protein n=1 Tax=Methylobacterium sp. WL18 TaxID=2603897 RepID=UPI0011CC5D46|nr:hypothetical protein [Methylobacterium sp. WL18]TXN75515.1 hypothetical protein FV228_03585 [Methylobacterium sp. WL18]